MPLPLDVFVVPHTHWDREWYHTAARFQTRLVALVDALLAAPADAARPFLLDGQMVVIDDYLSVRPDRRSDITHALQSGALEAGPWYVLADNLIPSGEAIIRNLEAGRRRLQRLGAVAPPVAYCPDTFGHPAALPQLAVGFGLQSAVVWRGFGGASHPPDDAVWWESTDGSRVLLLHLPPDGYEFGSSLPAIDTEAQARWAHIAATLAARNRSGVALLLSGADHHAAQPDFQTALSALADAAHRDGAVVHHSRLAHAAANVLHAVVARGTAVPVVQGELRDSYGYTWTLQGTFATRAHQKRRNAQLERALVHDVEPWLALAWLHAVPAFHDVDPAGVTTLAQLPALVNDAWETLLRTHPHDTLCGCSSDAVAAAMTARQRRVHSVLPELRHGALAGALHHDVVAARSRPVLAHPKVVVRNGVGRARGGIAEIEICETLADVAVGPNSATNSPVAVPVANNASSVVSPPTLADDNEAIVVQPLSTRVTYARRESPQHYPDNDLVRVHRVLAWVPHVPAMGLRVLNTTPALSHAQRASIASAAMPVTGPVMPVTVHRDGHRIVLDNGRVHVELSRRGLSMVLGTRRIDHALQLETVADVGDSYTPSLRRAAESLQLVGVRPGANGPLRASARMLWTWTGPGESIRVITEIALDADANDVRVHVRGVNRRRNHRLQMVWHTDVTSAVVTVDAAFGPVERRAIAVVPDAVPYETPPTTMPLHRWMSTHNVTGGVTVFSDGLAEGEAGASRMAVTLLRAVGELSRGDLPERPGHAGWPVSTPRSQCQGSFRARVGVMLHGPWSDAVHEAIRETADAMLVPLVGESWRDLHDAPRTVGGPALHGAGLVATAVHLHESRTAIVVRAHNVTDTVQSGAWTVPDIGAMEYMPCRLDGTPLGAWTPFDETFAFEAGAHAIVTHLIRRASDKAATRL